MSTDDRWEFRAKRKKFLERFGFPGTPAGDRMEEALKEVTDALLREARYHASWPVATAEQWRYDRMMWVFGIMLGEIPEDMSPPPADCVVCGKPDNAHGKGCFVGTCEAETTSAIDSTESNDF